jgi:DNA-binding CsgD family transcriptional regulator
MNFLTTAADERVLDVAFSDDALSVSLRDGRVISVPLVWYPRLLNATPAQRKNWKIAGGGYGIHWPDVDEDLSTEGLLRGAPASKMSIRTIGHNLTGRERELAHYIVEGLTNKEIAAQLNISLESVRTLVGRVFRKLGTSNRVTAKELLLRRTSVGTRTT